MQNYNIASERAIDIFQKIKMEMLKKEQFVKTKTRKFNEIFLILKIQQKILLFNKGRK